MGLSNEAIQARRRYYREAYHRRKSTAKGRAALERSQEDYWRKKFAEYAERDAAEGKRAESGNQ